MKYMKNALVFAIVLCSALSYSFHPSHVHPATGFLQSLDPDQRMKTQQIMVLETILAEQSGDNNFRDPEKYFAAFYGEPGKDNLWAWSFEGHHISLNFSIIGDQMSIAPRFMGANPATIPEGKRNGDRILGREEDFGFQLIYSLSDEQKSKTIFQSYSFSDIVTSNSTEVGPIKPVGIKMQALNKEQQHILLDLINEYISTMPAELATKRMNNLKEEEYDEIRFGWAGATEKGKPHYYRVQGKTFLIEFDNTQNNANHIHTVWRDFDGDFGRDLIREHYHSSGHHE